MPGLVARKLFPDELAAHGSNEALPLLMKNLLPPGLLGLMLAATVAACMSSLDSVFTAAASLFCLDLYRGHLRPAASGKEIATRPFQFITGRRCLGTAFGGWKTRDAIPMLVQRAMRGEITVDHFITHRFYGVGATKSALDALHSGDCLRAVVAYGEGAAA